MTTGRINQGSLQQHCALVTKGVGSRSLAARSVTERHCHTVLTVARPPLGSSAEYTPFQAFPRRHYFTAKRHRSLFNPFRFACSLCLSYYRHGKCSGLGGGLPPGYLGALWVGSRGLAGVHLAQWAKFWAKNQQELRILGQIFGGSGLPPGTRPQGVPGVQGVGQGCQGGGTGVGGAGGWGGGGGGVGSPKTHIKCTWFSYKGAANENAFEFCLHNFVFIVGPNFCGVWVVPGDAPPGGAKGAGGGAGVPGGWHRGGGGWGGGGVGGWGPPKPILNVLGFLIRERPMKMPLNFAFTILYS
jgi:hypothetical protein